MSAKIDGLQKLEHTLGQLIHAVEPAGRKKLGLKLGQLLRRSNTARIAKNVTPDGTPFEPRVRKKKQKGRLRNKMFLKLKAIRHLPVKRTNEEVTIQFKSRAARIAAVHHFGLRDKVTKNIQYKYPARPLLGFSNGDREAIEDAVLRHLAEAVG